MRCPILAIWHILVQVGPIWVNFAFGVGFIATDEKFPNLRT